jgi:hypothetical protein
VDKGAPAPAQNTQIRLGIRRAARAQNLRQIGGS